MARTPIFNVSSVKSNRRTLRVNGTPAEAALWKLLKNKQVGGLRFLRQFSIGNYVLDFYCPAIRLCIELDGEIHNDNRQEQHDIKRSQYFNAQNIHILRYENRLVWDAPDDIVTQIKEYCANLDNYVADNFW